MVGGRAIAMTSQLREETCGWYVSMTYRNWRQFWNSSWSWLGARTSFNETILLRFLLRRHWDSLRVKRVSFYLKILNFLIDHDIRRTFWLITTYEKASEMLVEVYPYEVHITSLTYTVYLSHSVPLTSVMTIFEFLKFWLFWFDGNCLLVYVAHPSAAKFNVVQKPR